VGQDVGTFTNPELQELYDLLVETGSQSLADALRVGVAIEEIDILDLEEWIAQTNPADIVGEAYQPQYLSQAAYDAIVSSPIERGGRGGQ